MTFFGTGGGHDWVTLQSGPNAGKVFSCPKCQRVGRAPRAPQCLGSEKHPHSPVKARIASEQDASRIDPGDPPVYR
jgi:hypothetical protein